MGRQEIKAAQGLCWACAHKVYRDARRSLVTVPPWSDIDTAWLAGLLEGEGSFGYYDSTPKVAIGMTDMDVRRKVSKMVGSRIYCDKRSGRLRSMYVVVSSGQRAIIVMQRIFPLMGKRRARKIAWVLKSSE